MGVSDARFGMKRHQVASALVDQVTLAELEEVVEQTTTVA
jgi:hypothetical protein